MRVGLRSGALTLAAIAITCRLVTPAGFMPGTLAAGQLFVLCHSTPLGVLLAREARTAAQAHHAVHAHAQGLPDAPDAHADAWEHCPLGVTTHDIGPAYAAIPVFTAAPAPAPAEPARVRPADARLVYFRPRAPPTVLPSTFNI